MDNKTKSDTMPPPFVVGIGASAGGLEALKQLFEHMDPYSGFSFVIIQHLSPDYKSLLSELLAPHTKMTIREARHNQRLEPNHIYIIPPGKSLTIQYGRLKIGPPIRIKGLQLPIDVFFRSLAADTGNAAVAVILSGTGSDGSKGILEIKASGGYVMVQEPHSAQFDGMPISAISTGAVDFVLPPEGIATQLGQLANITSIPEDNLNTVTTAETGESDQEDLLGELFHMIKLNSGVDFTYYKHSSLHRRIERRMALIKIPTLNEYLTYLKSHSGELAALRKDFLIGVTHFFRDSEAFQLLVEKVFPTLFHSNRTEQEIRVWVTACSTGEEAYSLAILMHQYLEQSGKPFTFKIFATDLSKDSIKYAANGIYTKAAIRNIPTPLLDRYLDGMGDTYQIRKEIRRLIVFAPHNIIKDPPFSNLDLVTCRNMLIYLQPEMQKKILSLFHYVLNEEGFLFLGPSETIGRYTNQFTVIDRKWNIFQHRESKNILSHTLKEHPAYSLHTAPSTSNRMTKETRGDLQPDQDSNPIYQALAEELLPPAILINSQNQVVFTSGDLSPYLQIENATPVWEISQLNNPTMRVALTAAIHKVRTDNQPLSYPPVKLDPHPHSIWVKLVIRPFGKLNSPYRKHIIVTFQPCQDELEAAASVEPLLDVSNNWNTDGELRHRMKHLEDKLRITEERLQATVEELETSNEELQSTNGQLVAANEELQSINEELHSVNEELLTVNTEFHHKIQELTDLNNDMNHFLIGTRIGSVFLDQDLRIRKFTPAVTKEIHLMDIDQGRPFSHISHQFKYIDLAKECERVLQEREPLEKEVQSKSGSWYNLRILPYRTAENMISGVVITFVDCTEMKQYSDSIHHLLYSLEHIPFPVMILSMDRKVQFVNPLMLRWVGKRLANITGRSLDNILDWSCSDGDSIQVWDRVIQSGAPWSGAASLKLPAKSSEVPVNLHLTPVKSRRGRNTQVVLTVEPDTSHLLKV